MPCSMINLPFIQDMPCIMIDLPFIQDMPCINLPFIQDTKAQLAHTQKEYDSVSDQLESSLLESTEHEIKLKVCADS